ncbi:hypothetical protein CDL15_Pgr024606 [Punica granatum]|nr:hypothetical protein CDL15_Pgr024606 [Punica granatum]
MRDQSSLELLPAFLLVKWDPQLSQAKPQATAQPQRPRLNPKPWLGRIKPRLLPMAGGFKGSPLPSTTNLKYLLTDLHPSPPITSHHFPSLLLLFPPNSK